MTGPRRPTKLHKYEVTIKREVEYTAIIEVEARNIEEAIDTANNTVDDTQPALWREGDVTNQTAKARIRRDDQPRPPRTVNSTGKAPRGDFATGAPEHVEQLKPAATIHNDPEGEPIMRRVEETFAALAKARNLQSRVTRPEAKKAAALAYKEADKAYRLAADARDRFVEVWNARKMQRSVVS